MDNTERIFEMLLDRDDALQGEEYDEIYGSSYDSIVDIVDRAIAAYFEKEIHDWYAEDSDQPIGTDKEKADALARYFEQLAKDLRNDYEI
jgi:hypothetical protein